MKRVVLDHLRRKAWLLALGAVVAAPLGWGIGALPEKGAPSLLGLVVQLGVLLGPGLLLYDLQRGAAGALALLPLSRRELARAWWTLGVGLPASLYSLAFAAGFFAGDWFSPGASHDIGRLFTALLWLWLITGTAFFALIQIPKGPAAGWKQQAANMGWVLVIWCGLLAGKIPLNAATLPILLTLGVGGTVLGWVFAERLVSRHPRPAEAAASAAPARLKPAPVSRPAWGDGLVYLTGQLCLRTVGAAALLIGALMLYHVFTHDGQSRRSPAASALLQCTGALPMLVLIGLQFLVSQLRLLRTLPLSTFGLSSLLLGLTLLPLVLIGLGAAGVTALLGEERVMFFVVLYGLVAAAAAALGLLGLIAVGGGKRGMVLVLLCFFGAQIALVPLMMHAFGPDSRPSSGIVAVVSLLVMLGVFFALPAVLARSGRIYRPGAPGLWRPAWGRGA